MLKPITRDNSTAVGKPWVYFCAHPEDLNVYLDELAQMILAHYDTAVWYPETDSSDEEHLLNLCDMRLFVVPVTRKLLDTENRARDLELPFAMENAIAILPILCEEALVNDFNRIFGTRHCLDRTVTERAALPFEKKLTDFLSSVLLRDDQLEAVRNAFSAGVFLSYRKKDREEARELMRLLHRDEACLDVGIWYDEYLTAGEDFNENISRALEKSDVLAVAVTPNVVNENNYVLSTELPLARDLGKPILAAEMVATDRGAFRKEDYDVRDGLVDGRSGALTALLLEKIREVKADRERCDRHDFYMGLAYLYGIYTEVDVPRALSLLTSAAEGGDTEAMQKLADVYTAGLGVPRDFMRASEWMARRVDTLAASFDRITSADEVALFLQSILEYCNSALLAGTDPVARRLVEDNLPVARTLASLPEYDTGRFLLARMVSILGSLLMAEGARTRGIELLREAEVLYDALASGERCVEYYKGLYDCRNQLAGFSMDAEEKRDLYLANYRLLRDNVDLLGGEDEYPAMYGNVLCDLYQSYAEAGEESEASIYAPLVEQSVAALRAAKHEADALQLEASYGRARTCLLPPEEREAHLEKMLVLHRRLIEELGEASQRQLLASIAFSLGEMKLDKEPASALACFEEGLAACRVLRDTGANTPILRFYINEGLSYVGRAHYRLGNNAMATGDTNAVREHYEAAARSFEGSFVSVSDLSEALLKDMMRRMDDHITLSRIYNFLDPKSGRAAAQLRMSAECGEELLRIWEACGAVNQRAEANMLLAIAESYLHDKSSFNRAEKCLRRAIALCRELVAENNEEDMRVLLAKGCLLLATVLLDRGGTALDSALTFCEEALAQDQGTTDRALHMEMMEAHQLMLSVFSKMMEWEQDGDKQDRLITRVMRILRREISSCKKRYETDRSEGKTIAAHYVALAKLCEVRDDENDLSDAAYYRELAKNYQQNSDDAQA